MKRLMVLVGVLASVLGTPANAGIYGDALAKCLVERTTDADKTSAIAWVFAAMSAHPAVKTMAKVTPEDRTRASQRFSTLSQDLLLKRCRTETVAAVRYEGSQTIEASFGVLGQIAMRGLMTDPAVTPTLAQIGEFADKDAMNALLAEAGVVVPAKMK